MEKEGRQHQRGKVSWSVTIETEEGTIEAENVIIAGYFEGELACSGLLTIAKTGTVKGRVAYGTLLVELGGVLDAEVFQLESRDTKLVPFHPKGVHSDK